MTKLKPHAVSKRQTIALILIDQPRHMLIFFTPRHMLIFLSDWPTAHLSCTGRRPLQSKPPSLIFRGTFLSGNIYIFRAQELCESRGGRPGRPVPTKPTVSVDVKQHFNQGNIYDIYANWLLSVKGPLISLGAFGSLLLLTNNGKEVVLPTREIQ